jgi:hypothetical protein
MVEVYRSGSCRVARRNRVAPFLVSGLVHRSDARYARREALNLKACGTVTGLRHPWRDGTTELVFDSVDFIARLAALVPPPRTNLIRYHGVFAPAARLRSKIVQPQSTVLAQAMAQKKADAHHKQRRRNLLWAELMSRVFGLNVLVCPECAGRCRVIACIEDPSVIRKILGHLGLSTQPARLSPARGPPDQLEFVDIV